MLMYWLLFTVPLLASVSPARLDIPSRRIAFMIAAVALAVIIGLRDDVGRDWNNYIKIYDRVVGLHFWDIFLEGEPGYSVLAWASDRMGLGVYGANFVCGAILAFGLISFCRAQPAPWRTLTLAIPVLVIGIGMSGIRQATAIGFFMLAMNAYVRQRLISYVVWVLIGTVFHQTLAIFLLLAWFMRRGLNVGALAVAGGLFLFVGIFVLSESMNYYTTSYLQESPDAQGALPRVALNVLAAGVFFYYRKRWDQEYLDTRLFTLLALLSVVLAAGVIAAPVASDRMSMYLLPFQIAVLSRFPDLLRGRMAKLQAVLGVYLIYGAVLAVWLNFSRAAQSNWIPYQTIIF